MLKQLRIVVVLTLALLAVLELPHASTNVCYGQGSKRRLENNREKRDKAYQQILQLNKQKGPLSDEAANLEGSMDGKESEIVSIKKQLALAEDKNSSLDSERAALEVKLGERQQALGERMRAVYMQGDFGYIDLIFHAKSFGDLIDRIYFIQAVCEKDKQMITQQRESQAAIGAKISEIQATIAGISEMKSKLQAQYQQLASLREDKLELINNIDNSKELLLRQIAEWEAENKRIAELSRSAEHSASGYKGRAWSGSFIKPCVGEITSGFGYRIHPIFGIRKMHTGVDIANKTGTRINAAGDGKVIQTGRMGGYGNAVLIDHGNHRCTLYGHMSRITCTAGQIVKAGDKIGEIGSTGWATGPHCHFEVRIDGTPVDPLKEL